jgi:indole-3-glycerol phosphate synthase
VSDSQAADEAVVLRYAAKDDAYLIGVPARDLTTDDLGSPELERFGKTKPTVIKRLVESGLYTEADNSAGSKESN